jgi:muramoyltetrapeptide carboxypeptidase
VGKIGGFGADGYVKRNATCILYTVHMLAPRLQPHDLIALVAPASATEPELAASAIANLEALGYRTRVFGELATHHGYLSASDTERAVHLQRAIEDPEVKLVLAVRGGYGVGRMLEHLDFTPLRWAPKLIAGFSDITALHAAVWKTCGLISFHSPNAVDGFANGRGDDASRAALIRALSGEPLEYTGGGALTPGVARGRMLGGNVAIVAALVGTPWELDLRGAILCLEDIGEAPYRIDRMLWQLRAAGCLHDLAGVVLGHFTDCMDRPGKLSPTVEDVLAEYLTPLGIPVLTNFPSGHESPNFAWPHGALVELDASAGRISVLEPVVA